MIIRLSLKNFRKHESFEADFTAGLNGIFGPNYRGKSTIEYGILYALGGIRAVPCRTVLRTGASTFRVDMTFRAGDVYLIVRTKSTDRLYAGDTEDDAALIANGATVVNAKIEEIIGMSMKRFLQTRFARQKHTDAILLSGANALYAAINEISGADTVDAALKRLAERVTKLDGYLDNTVAPDVEDTQIQLRMVEKNRSIVQGQQSELQAKSQESTAMLQTAADLLAAMAAAELAASTHESNLRHAEKDHTRVTSELEAARLAGAEYVDLDIDQLTTELECTQEALRLAEERDAELNRLQQDSKGAARRVESHKAAWLKATEQFAQLVKPAGVPKGTPSVTDLQVGVSKIQAECAVMVSQLTALNSQVKDSCCPTCNRAFEGMTAEDLQKMEEKKVQLSSEIEAKQTEFHTASTRLTEVTKIWEAYQTAQSEFDTSTSALQFQIDSSFDGETKAMAEYTEAEKAIKLLGDGQDIAALRNETRRIDNVLREAERCKKSIAKAEAEVDKYSAALQELMAVEVPKYDFANHANLKRNHELLKAAKDVAAEKLAACNTELAVIENSHLYLSNLLPVQQEHAAAIAEAEGKRSTAKSLQKFLKVNRDRYMADVWSVLMAEASQFASQCTSGAIECVSRTVEGDFTYTENGTEFPISEASGAQLSIMGLAMQVALSSAVQPPLDVLIVDEPNADMDPEHSMAANILLSAAVGQVICVSHAAMDSSICQNVIEL